MPATFEEIVQDYYRRMPWLQDTDRPYVEMIARMRVNVHASVRAKIPELELNLVPKGHRQ